MKLEYNEKLEFSKLEYSKNNKSLHIFDIMVN